MAKYHFPVLKNEVVNFWINSAFFKKNKIVLLDATCGEGGHSLAILKKAQKLGFLEKLKIICLDADAEILKHAQKRLNRFSDNLIFINDNFVNIDKILADLKIEKLDGALADLGISMFHYKKSGRGFSLLGDEELDMRLTKFPACSVLRSNSGRQIPTTPDSQDELARLQRFAQQFGQVNRCGRDSKSQNINAKYIINNWGQKELEEIFKNYGEEKWSKRIAQKIVAKRKNEEIKTASQLAQIVKEAIPAKFQPRHIHAATRVFQALRIAVNNELSNLEKFLKIIPTYIAHNGHILIISFHSLEDRIVKQNFKSLTLDRHDEIYGRVIEKAQFENVVKKPIFPGDEEVEENSASRSAKLRIIRKR